MTHFMNGSPLQKVKGDFYLPMLWLVFDSKSKKEEEEKNRKIVKFMIQLSSSCGAHKFSQISDIERHKFLFDLHVVVKK